jgi:hypothetical protein
MPFGYVSPGDAFSSSLENALVQRELMRQRQVESDLAVQREQRQAANEAEERRQAQEALDEKRRAFDESRNDKAKSQFEKTVQTMVPGDIPSPELLDQAKKFGYGHLFPADNTAVVDALPTPAGIAADPDAQPGPMPQPVPEAPLPQKFVGTPGQREDAAFSKAVNDIADHPEMDSREQALRLQAQFPKRTIPAGVYKEQGAGGDGTAVARVDPQRKVVQRLVNGQWVDQTGDVPKGTHFLQEPDPSVAAGIAANRDASLELRREQQRIGAHQNATAQLNKVALPYEDQSKNLEAAEAVLNERTPSGDAHAAPAILKAIVAGQGSGFRMTKAEIDQVQNARSVWQSLEAKFRRFDPNGNALFYDDKQRGEFLKLIQTMRSIGQRHLDKVQQARHELNDAPDAKSIEKRMTQLHDELLQDAKDQAAKGNGKRIVYDLNGNPVKQ